MNPILRAVLSVNLGLLLLTLLAGGAFFAWFAFAPRTLKGKGNAVFIDQPCDRFVDSLRQNGTVVSASTGPNEILVRYRLQSRYDKATYRGVFLVECAGAGRSSVTLQEFKLRGMPFPDEYGIQNDAFQTVIGAR